MTSEKEQVRRDRRICYLRKKFKWTHARLAERFDLTESRVEQILRRGKVVGIRPPYKNHRPKKTKPVEVLPEEPSESYESPQEEAEMRRWARHVRFLDP